MELWFDRILCTIHFWCSSGTGPVVIRGSQRQLDGLTRPKKLFPLIAKLSHGKAAFKAFLASLVMPDVANLPNYRKLLTYLQAERRRGREFYLATEADARLAECVASHLGLFPGVLASEGVVNLTGNQKLNRLRATLSDSFSYIGNASADLPLLLEAPEPMVANSACGGAQNCLPREFTPLSNSMNVARRLRTFIKALGGSASAYAAVVVFAIYISSQDVMAHYSRPTRLWLAVPLLLFWLSRHGSSPLAES